MALDILHYSAAKEAQNRFNPYDDNGGTIVAIGGKNFVVIASDTRLSTGYSIYTRNQTKLFKLSNNAILGSSGCWCDSSSFTRLLNARMQIYLYEHNKQMSTSATAQLISTMMYYKRFFPYYVSNVLAGLDANGEGWVYSYDPIGSMETKKFHSGGSSGHLMQPLLDNQLGLQNLQNVKDNLYSLEKAVKITKDMFISASERDIYTGDAIHIYIITPDGLQEEKFDLRKD